MKVVTMSRGFAILIILVLLWGLFIIWTGVPCPDCPPCEEADYPTLEWTFFPDPDVVAVFHSGVAHGFEAGAIFEMDRITALVNAIPEPVDSLYWDSVFHARIDSVLNISP